MEAPRLPLAVEHRSEPIVARRAWGIRTTLVGPVLGSITHRGLWPHRTLLASCEGPHGFPTTPGHRVPDPLCSCGIYAVPDDGSPLLFRGHLWVEGRVALSGRVIEGPRGFRAERATILDLRIGVRCAGRTHRGSPISGVPCTNGSRDHGPEWTVVTDGAMTPLCDNHLADFDDLRLHRYLQLAMERAGRPAHVERSIEFTSDLVVRLAQEFETRYGVPVTI
jgi:hypothetical protein